MENLTPEEIEAIFGISTTPEELEMLKMQMLRNDQSKVPTPQGTMAGRVYVGANPLEHIGAFMQNRNATKRGKELDSKYESIIEALRKGRGAYGRGVVGAGMGGMQPAGPQGNGVTTYPVQ